MKSDFKPFPDLTAKIRQKIIIAFFHHFLGLNQCNLLSCNYGQECSMDKHGITECVCPKSCEPIVRPVCATDGKTYDNMCEMKKSACNQRLNITAKYIGVCGKNTFNLSSLI